MSIRGVNKVKQMVKLTLMRRRRLGDTVLVHGRIFLDLSVHWRGFVVSFRPFLPRLQEKPGTHFYRWVSGTHWAGWVGRIELGDWGSLNWVSGTSWAGWVGRIDLSEWDALTWVSGTSWAVKFESLDFDMRGWSTNNSVKMCLLFKSEHVIVTDSL